MSNAAPVPEHTAPFRAAFARAMVPFGLAPGARVAVAVSGGPDSLALAHLLADWSAPLGIHVRALTVDHRLRDEAAAEAAQVGAWMALRGIPHTMLSWPEGHGERRLSRSPQNASREARYRLMSEWCLANDVAHLFVAHHADDQVETFLLRLSRGSGVDGLASMASASARGGITILRPLLHFTKAELADYCRVIGQAWIEDPSNANLASARVRFRKARALLEREGLTRDRLLATVCHLQRARTALDQAVSALLGEAVTWDEVGVATLQIPAILRAPDEIALRALARVLTAAGGQDYGPRFESLERFFTHLKSGPWRDTTLHGSAIVRSGKVLRIFREAAHIDHVVPVRDGVVVWDGRFRIAIQGHPGGDLNIRRLTPADWSAIAAACASSPAAACPARVRETLPAVFDSMGLIAVPHALYTRRRPAAGEGLSLVATCISGASASTDAEL